MGVVCGCSACILECQKAILCVACIWWGGEGRLVHDYGGCVQRWVSHVIVNKVEGAKNVDVDFGVGLIVFGKLET